MNTFHVSFFSEKAIHSFLEPS
ncbi:hypothetical protein CAEBREN_09407 [Caenorhabditis brenneri]|uniref:Uncharacterized protein n=1 Tax=Caenorhabditis brenneri TaxID=135651 RepID=G0P6N8_CAEBE|nr:hypothetical protein CAEBREN_09407 [Caenorhabditis brenneri]